MHVGAAFFVASDGKQMTLFGRAEGALLGIDKERIHV